jgi:hypothetical protein
MMDPEDLPTEQKRFKYAMRMFYIKGDPRVAPQLAPPGV